MLSSSYAFVVLLVIILFFIGFKYFTLSQNEFNSNFKFMYVVAFVFSILVAMTGTNMSVAKSRCANPSTDLVVKATLPWLLLFGGTVVALEYLPSWKIPFANTFGYMVYHMEGKGNALIQRWLKNDGHDSYKFILEDPSLFVNTLTLDNFQEVMATSFNVPPEGDLSLRQLFKLIVLKTVTADFIWYLLVGSVVMTMSYNTIITASCNKN